MTVAVFLLLLLGAVPIALVLALTAMWYIQASGNTVLFDSYPQQLFSAIETKLYWPTVKTKSMSC